VVNFDVPKVPEDYVHRVGRTARAEALGSAFTFVSPEEEADLRKIESAIGKRLPRVTVPDFDYAARPAGPLEIPRADRVAAMRREKQAARANVEAKKQRALSRPPTMRPHQPASRQGPTRPSGARAAGHGSRRPGRRRVR